MNRSYKILFLGAGVSTVCATLALLYSGFAPVIIAVWALTMTVNIAHVCLYRWGKPLDLG